MIQNIYHKLHYLLICVAAASLYFEWTSAGTVIILIVLWVVIGFVLYSWPPDQGEISKSGSFSHPLEDLNINKDSLNYEETKSYIQKFGHEHIINASTCIAVGIVNGDQTDFFAFGRLTEGAAPDENTVFEIASVGKTLTALLFSELVERNEISLDEPINSLLPKEVKAPRHGKENISLLDLATHTSGLPRLPKNLEPSNPLNPYADYTVPQMYEGLEMVRLKAPIGRHYCYSNFGFGLLGHLLALKMGADHENLVVKNICDPLNLDSTRVTLTPELRARVATPHAVSEPVEIWQDQTLTGAGSFLSTVADMLTYVRAHWSENDDSLHRAMKAAIRKRRPTDTSEISVGLGWHITSENSLEIVWHNGGSGGSRSYVAMLPDDHIGVIVLANSTSSEVEDLGRKIVHLLKLSAC